MFLCAKSVSGGCSPRAVTAGPTASSALGLLPPRSAFQGHPVGHARWLCFTDKAESLFLSILLVLFPISLALPH